MTPAAVVTLMGALTRAGITPAHAETLARHLRTHGWAELGGGAAGDVDQWQRTALGDAPTHPADPRP